MSIDPASHGFALELRGMVHAFDIDRGLGEILGDDGVVYPLHCTQIADGSRTVPAGVPVTFAVLRKLGRYEAADVRLA
jgi:cold shock CspA family protein